MVEKKKTLREVVDAAHDNSLISDALAASVHRIFDAEQELEERKRNTAWELRDALVKCWQAVGVTYAFARADWSYNVYRVQMRKGPEDLEEFESEEGTKLHALLSMFCAITTVDSYNTWDGEQWTNSHGETPFTKAKT